MAIDWQRPEYEKALPEWRLVDKVVDEEDLGTLLPKLNPLDMSEQNKQRNRDYQDRASWFGASQMTLAGLIGVAFDDAPEIDLPAALDYLRTNCDGEGVDLQQQMQASLGQTLRKGRCGIYVTFPERDGPTSLREQQEGQAIATIHLIEAQRIINWWTEKDGAQVKIGGVVFTDTKEVVEDYEVTQEPRLRELALEGGVFVARTWGKTETGKTWEVLSETYPKDGAGNLWRELPFIFLGSLDNTTKLDRPPLLSLARLNRDHYRNSADNEESVWYAGQAQPYIETGESGATQEDIKTAQESGFYIGSRQLIVGKMGFAQADPNTGARQAMIDKMEAMKALGARFIMPGTVAKTATQDAGEQRVQHSILSLCVANVEDAYNRALGFVGAYMNVTGEAAVALSRDFMNPDLTPEYIDRILGFWDRGLIGAFDVLPTLKKANLIEEDKTPEDYSEEVEQRGGMMLPTTGAADDGTA